jgi:hypothetical protein
MPIFSLTLVIESKSVSRSPRGNYKLPPITRIHVCDIPEKFESLSVKFGAIPGIIVMPDGHAVARSSDFIIYSVEARIIQDVVAQFAQCQFILFLISPPVHFSDDSDQTRGNRRRPNICKGSRKIRI